MANPTEYKPNAKFTCIPNTDNGYLTEGKDDNDRKYIMYNYTEEFTPMYPQPRNLGEGKYGDIMLWCLKDSNGREVSMFIPSQFDNMRKSWGVHYKFMPVIECIGEEDSPDDIRVKMGKELNSKGRMVWTLAEVRIVDGDEEEEEEIDDPVDDAPTVKETSIAEWTRFVSNKKKKDLEKYSTKDGQKILIAAMISEKGSVNLSKSRKCVIDVLTREEADSIIASVFTDV